MSYMFCVTNGLMTLEKRRRYAAAANEEDAEFVYAELPEGPRSWFVAENLGEPFNSDCRARVMKRLGLC